MTLLLTYLSVGLALLAALLLSRWRDELRGEAVNPVLAVCTFVVVAWPLYALAVAVRFVRRRS